MRPADESSVYLSQDLFLEARQCIEDCADSAETNHFDEEAVAARDAVEVVSSAYADILDDLEGAERETDGYPYGIVKRSDFVRKLQSVKVDELKGELATIMRNLQPPMPYGDSV